jgi:predicted MFS family arabinose efflux permease
MKADLHLSDTQLGFMTGTAFGLVYAVLGVPFARWTDRGERNRIASFAMGLWGVTMMVCPLVTNFTQLVAARVSTAVGEAGCMPPTYSLVGDYFQNPSQRTRAMTIYMLSNPLSLLLSFLLGGKLNDLYGWRITFFAMAIPAVVLAVLVRATLRETRKVTRRRADDNERPPTVAALVVVLWRCRSMRHLLCALVLLYTMGLGLSPWYGSFMVRSHAMGSSELGLALGLIFGLGGIVGVLSGGYIAERWFSGDEQGQMRTVAVATALLVPCFALFVLSHNTYLALLGLLPFTIGALFFSGPIFALMQRLVAHDIRATTLAVVMLIYNVVGMGIGPQVVGLLSDAYRPVVGIQSLRYAMLSFALLSLWAAYHFWQVGKTVRQDLVSIGCCSLGAVPTALSDGMLVDTTHEK